VKRLAAPGDKVASVTRDGFDDVLNAVTAAASAYRGGLTNDAATAVRASGISPWTPIYSQLLTELQATLQVAGERYDRLADAGLIDGADRFEWRACLTTPDCAPHGSDPARPVGEPDGVGARSASRPPG
jgi:hypothetical protein